MNDKRDSILDDLFSNADVDLSDSAFTDAVMSRVRARNLMRLGTAAIICVGLLIFALLFSVPLQALAVILTEVLGTQIFVIGDSTLAWILAPVNNLATLLVVLGKGLRMSWNRIRQASYAT